MYKGRRKTNCGGLYTLQKNHHDPVIMASVACSELE